MTSFYESIERGGYTFLRSAERKGHMKKSLILLAILSISTTNVLAGNPIPGEAAVLVQPVAAEVRAKRMTDADLDNVTAGVSKQNPGRALVYIEHRNGTVTCINDPRCAAPPPPPPTGR